MARCSSDGRARLLRNTHAAFGNLEAIVAYWTDRDEPERGEQCGASGAIP